MRAMAAAAARCASGEGTGGTAPGEGRARCAGGCCDGCDLEVAVLLALPPESLGRGPAPAWQARVEAAHRGREGERRGTGRGGGPLGSAGARAGVHSGCSPARPANPWPHLAPARGRDARVQLRRLREERLRGHGRLPAAARGRRGLGHPLRRRRHLRRARARRSRGRFRATLT
jgi:hypothetical protein